MNDFRKIDLLDAYFIQIIKKHLTIEDQTKFFTCVKRLPFEVIAEILNKYLKQKCVQIN